MYSVLYTLYTNPPKSAAVKVTYLCFAILLHWKKKTTNKHSEQMDFWVHRVNLFPFLAWSVNRISFVTFFTQAI